MRNTWSVIYERCIFYFLIMVLKVWFVLFLTSLIGEGRSSMTFSVEIPTVKYLFIKYILQNNWLAYFTWQYFSFLIGLKWIVSWCLKIKVIDAALFSREQLSVVLVNK